MITRERIYFILNQEVDSLDTIPDSAIGITDPETWTKAGKVFNEINVDDPNDQAQQ